MSKVLTLEGAQARDRELMALGLTSDELMESVACAMADKLGAGGGKKALFLLGVGHNGGDGAVMARRLTDWQVTALVVADEGRTLKELTAQKIGLLPAAPAWSRDLTDDELRAACDVDLIIDAIEGLGSCKALTGEKERVVAAANSSRARRLALDLPTGLNGLASGGLVFRAHETYTVEAPKVNMLWGKGPEYCGLVHTIPLSSLATATEGIDATDVRWEEPPAPDYPDWAHKGTRGGVLLFCGSETYPGAGQLAALAALRGGAGFVVWALPSALRPTFAALLPEAITVAVDDGAQAQACLETWGHKCDALVVGSGLGRDQRAGELCDVARSWSKSTVWDGDGLAFFASQSPQPSEALRVLTPHGGEAQALLGAPPFGDGESAYQAARFLSDRWQSAVVLKGHGTWILSKEKAHYVYGSGRELAVPGSGDTLAGLLGARLASPFCQQPLVSAVATHGAAGLKLRQAFGPDGLLAREISAAFGKKAER